MHRRRFVNQSDGFVALIDCADSDTPELIQVALGIGKSHNWPGMELGQVRFVDTQGNELRGDEAIGSRKVFRVRAS